MLGTDSDNKTQMIMEMEKKLNPAWFLRRKRPRDDYCTLSIA